MARARNAGIRLRSAGTRTEPLKEAALEKMGRGSLKKRLSAATDRDVNFMIYESARGAASRSPSITMTP